MGGMKDTQPEGLRQVEGVGREGGDGRNANVTVDGFNTAPPPFPPLPFFLDAAHPQS